ncbi:MAG: DUF6152 family protein [Gammaproteobacteria bacterium]|nr:DUF6152 family protein [Gammaproteobacteria bacterium]
MRKLSIFVVSIVAIMVASSLANAHHGWGGYKERLEMTVTVKELALRNPHDRLIVVDADGNEWNLLLAPPARNRRFGFSEESVSVGDQLELFGQKHPSRNEVKVHCLYRDGENIYSYRYDNGRTSLSRVRQSDRKDC